jgi:ribosomal protein S18 acetylase RimI-like enzyme
MIAHDWRICGADEVAPLYAGEVARWLSALHWDTRDTWLMVEAARAVGSLPGLVVRDAQGAVRGWTFYLRHEDALQIGAFVADTPEATAALLDSILASSHAASASALVLFAFSTAPALTTELEARGFVVEGYRYLEASLTAHAGLKPCATHEIGTGATGEVGPGARGGVGDVAQGFSPACGATGELGPCATGELGPGARGDVGDVAQGFSPACWQAGDQFAVAALLASAYPSEDPARPFARHGRPHEWSDYVRQLVTTTGCGTFLPHASFVGRGASSSRALAATLVTRLSSDTVHLAQIAVAPDARGRGLARRLIGASLAAAGCDGCTRATLLVGERNPGARRVYDRLGFTAVATFVSAVRDQPRRSTSAALDTGGAITLR